MVSITSAQNPSDPNAVLPGGPLTAQMGIDQNFGRQVPLDATFQDETGKRVKFGDMLQDKPMMILPMFFQCNGVCRLEVEELFGMLEKDKDISAGKDFNLVLLSINPTETPKIASDKMKLILGAYHIPGDGDGVHGLVGDLDDIHKVTDALGFRYSYNSTTQAINHPAGMMFLDKNGVVRGYIYGKDYPTVVVANNLKAAALATNAPKPEIVWLGCIMVDPVTGRKTLVIENVMKVVGSLFALCLGGSILYMTRKYKTPPTPPTRRGGSAAA